MNKPNRVFLLAIVIIAIAAGLYYLDSLAAPSCGQYKDGFICSPRGTEPVSFTRNLINSSQRATIVFEADIGKTQANIGIDASATQLAIYFGKKNPEIYGIAFNNSLPASCLNSQNNSLPASFCQNIKAEDNELVLLLKYPSYGRNEIIARSDRVIEFHAVDSLNQLALVRAMFGKIFFP
ncbi:hypothetical protein HY546_00560 [archaeon]|nr:hypothetical protein [archaeon]